MNVMEAEVNRVLQLCDSCIIPITWQVPRKVKHEDIKGFIVISLIRNNPKRILVYSVLFYKYFFHSPIVNIMPISFRRQTGINQQWDLMTGGNQSAIILSLKLVWTQRKDQRQH